MTTTGNTTQRGYGYTHQQQRKRWVRTMARQGGAPCARCGGWIDPAEAWHLDHDDVDSGMYLGPSHEWCNTSAGGTKARGKIRESMRPRSRQW